MSDWKIVAVGDIATIERQVVSAESIKNGTKYVGLENIQPGGALVGVKSVEEGELASAKLAFSGEHILYGKLRPYLAKIARPDFSGVCSTDILPIKPGPKVLRDYLLFYLRQPSVIKIASSLATGASLPRLSQAMLGRMQVPLPSLSEQRRITAVLDQADALRAKRRETLAELDELIDSVFLDMVGDPGCNPRSWPVVRLGDLLVEGPQNGLYKPSSSYGRGVRILRIDSFRSGAIGGLELLKRVDASEDEVALYGLRNEDIVLNRVNSIEHLGKSVLIPAISEPLLFESNMMRFRVDSARLLPRYAAQVLSSRYAQRYIVQSAKQAINQASINQRDVREFQFPLPPLDLQHEFARRVEAIERMKESQRAHLAELDALFASLQDRAFRGEL
ncbi:restriction endonuclease subunit S [Saccharomonospora cyanea]|uniref:Restriction endonuclease S subunit n=1 Tax=Saccharomonospora cyanea NA-134 TaxID=882082 RepID=H5XN66_9PSEU|nr:restriction endonuclease subunit S [Saccharomonospora cyanea]EHR63699.1 restriction endonuclease S subunit [Saccharomonospora cyanea NA-134]